MTADLVCELCAARASRPVLTLDFTEYGYPGEFQLFRCEACGLIHNAPRLSDTALAALYDANYYLFMERPAAAIARIVDLYQTVVATLSTRTTERRVLEVGCAKGWMLALLRELGWSVQGVELSDHAAGYARERLALPVYTGTLESCIANPDFTPFPVVYSTDVIEHVSNLDAFATALATATAPGGWLLVGTPNGDARGIASLGADWLGFNPFHIRFLNRANLTALLERHGFQVTLAYTCNNLEPQVSPQPRASARLAAALGCLDQARRIKAWIGESRDLAIRGLDQRIRDAAHATTINPAYVSTRDAQEREACLGDNLVILAHKG